MDGIKEIEQSHNLILAFSSKEIKVAEETGSVLGILFAL